MFGKSRRRNPLIETLVGENTRIEGDLKFDGGCHIDGVVQGGVVADRDSDAFLSVSQEGRIEGSVRVPHVVLNGKVEGDLWAWDKVELGPTARVTGNVHYNLIEMASGSEINGQLVHEVTPKARPARPAENPSGIEGAAGPVPAPGAVKSGG